MSTHNYGHMLITGSSVTSSDDAIKNAVAKAGEQSNALRWFEVKEVRGHLQDGAVAHWQVTVDIGYQMD